MREQRKSDVQVAKSYRAVRRGIIGAAVGFAVLLFLLVSTGNSLGGSGIYLLIGPIYGFGFAFANWKAVASKTGRAVKEGGAVLGIGVLLSSWTKHSRFGLFGLVYFIIRVCWHIGFCWIPGIFYGIAAIRRELTA